jgi:hypothetical protein
MSARIVRRSIALGIAALVLGFAGTNTARADHRDNYRGRNAFQTQSRQWRNDDVRRSWSHNDTRYFRNDDCDRRFRDDDCGRRERFDSFRSCNRPSWRDSSFGFSFDFGRSGYDRNGCR